MFNSVFKYSILTIACSQAFNSSLIIAAESEQEENNKITITGSRIKQVDAEEASPVVTITQDDIRGSTSTNLSDLMKELSITHGGEGSFSTSSSGALQADSPVGTAAVSLRGLGASSTLVLINGRRVAASSFAFRSQNFVDINAIPLAAIERVEILPSGASAIYGADAVAGVVNLILKQSVNNAELNLSYANSEASSNDAKKNVNFVWGMSNDKTDFNLFIDYYKTETLYDREREQTAVSFAPSQQGIWPSFNGQFFDDIDYVEASCPDDLRFDGRAGFDTSAFGEYCQYNQNSFLPTYPGIESVSAGFYSNTALNGDLNWSTEVFASQTESSANSTSAPFSGVEVDFNHPNMPDELADRFNDLWDDLGVPPEDFLLMWGRFAMPRTLQSKSQSFRIVSGLDGVINNWDWNSSINYSSSKSEQRGVAGIVNVAKYEAALFGELCNDGNTNCSPGNGGLYFNPFNGGADNSEEVLNLIQENVPRDGTSKLFSIDFNIAGELMELENGFLESAFGIEARREDIEDSPSELATADPTNNNEVPVYGFGSTGAKADRNIYALYAEFLIPLAENFTLNLAGRYDHYSDFGGDFNPKVGMAYKPNDNLLLRGSWSTSFRAPSLAQIGADTTLSSGSLDCGPEFFDNFCGGFGGSDGYLSEIYGNPELEAEESEAFDFGLVFNFNDQTSLTLDYWAFKHDNIVGIDDEALFRAALRGDVSVAAADELAADEIGIETRDGTIGAPIEEIHLQLENLGVQETSGIDLTYTQRWDWGSNRLTFLVDGTYLLDYQRQLSKQAEIEELEGTFRYPELLLRTQLRLTNDRWSTSISANYTSSYDDDLEKYSENDLSLFGIATDREVPSWIEWRLSVSYELTKNSYLRFGIQNLFDNEAPVAYGTGANVDHSNHGTMGRFYRLSYTHSF